jgi:hypothetical protein
LKEIEMSDDWYKRQQDIRAEEVTRQARQKKAEEQAHYDGLHGLVNTGSSSDEASAYRALVRYGERYFVALMITTQITAMFLHLRGHRRQAAASKHPQKRNGK